MYSYKQAQGNKCYMQQIETLCQIPQIDFEPVQFYKTTHLQMTKVKTDKGQNSKHSKFNLNYKASLQQWTFTWAIAVSIHHGFHFKINILFHRVQQMQQVLTSSSVGIILSRISPTVSMSALMLRMLHISPPNDRARREGGVGVSSKATQWEGNNISD